MASERENIFMLDMAKLVSSMFEAYNLAGGIPPSIEDLQKWSALEFFYRIAPNNIRFRYEAPVLPYTGPPLHVNVGNHQASHSADDDIPF